MYKSKMHLGHNVIMRNVHFENFLLGCRNGTDIIDLDQVRSIKILIKGVLGVKRCKITNDLKLRLFLV